MPHSIRPHALRALAALAALATLAHQARAQQPRAVGSSANAWLDVGSDVWLTPRLAVQGGGRLQRARLGAAPQQSELRLGVQRSIGRRFRIATGGVLVHYSPNGPFPASTPYDERRLWQHVLQEQHVGHVALQHRYRLEERWTVRPQPNGAEGDDDSDVSFGLRARYQLRATVPLGPSRAAHAPYATASEEAIKSVGPHATSNVIDQNRTYAGVGVRWSTALRGEVGYLNQRILRANGRQLEHAHTVQLTLGVTRPAPSR